MGSQRRVLLAIWVAVAGAAPALAKDGRIPVFQPAALTSGSYVVTRNISGSIVIAAGADVDLDLNGMEINQPSSGNVAIEVEGGGTDVRIHDGSVRGGLIGINVRSGTKRVVIERTRVAGSFADAVRIEETEQFVVRDNMFHDIADPANGTGVRIVVNGGIAKQGLIADNAIRNAKRGIVVLSAHGIVVSGNRMINLVGTGIDVSDGQGVQILNNVIRSAGLGIEIDPVSSDNLIEGNSITGSGLGIEVTGDRNILDGNLCNGNSSWGIKFQSAASNNVYRANIARGNSGGAGCLVQSTPDFCVEAAGNTSAGNNFLPSAGM